MARQLNRDPQQEQFWRDTVAAWEKSGKDIRAFCLARGLREGNFYYWRRALRSQSPPRSKWVSVHVIPEPNLEVVLPTGVVVRAPAGAEPSAVARLVAALREASC